jgi:hypothetical protein
LILRVVLKFSPIMMRPVLGRLISSPLVSISIGLFGQAPSPIDA